MEELSQEFNDFVMLEDDDIPASVREEAKSQTSDGKYRQTSFGTPSVP